MPYEPFLALTYRLLNIQFPFLAGRLTTKRTLKEIWRLISSLMVSSIQSATKREVPYLSKHQFGSKHRPYSIRLEDDPYYPCFGRRRIYKENKLLEHCRHLCPINYGVLGLQTIRSLPYCKVSGLRLLLVYLMSCISGESTTVEVWALITHEPIKELVDKKDAPIEYG